MKHLLEFLKEHKNSLLYHDQDSKSFVIEVEHPKNRDGFYVAFKDNEIDENVNVNYVEPCLLSLEEKLR